MDIVAYKGWSRNVRLANDRMEMVVTLDVGPRIIRLAAPGGRNVFKNYADQMGGAGETEWQIRGGHRLWVAPEDPVATYFPDNGPVEARAIRGGARLRPAPEKPNGIQKEMDVTIDPERPEARIVHRIRNIGRRRLTLAVWGLSVMAPGGTAVVSLPVRGSHPQDLLPNQRLVLWPYTDLSDRRWRLGARSILLAQRRGMPPTKLGLLNLDGWAAYAVHGCLFVKHFECRAAADYPDMGCNTELFTNAEMLEVESLGRLVTLEPGGRTEHVERWRLLTGVPPVRTVGDVESHVRPLIEGAV